MIHETRIIQHTAFSRRVGMREQCENGAMRRHFKSRFPQLNVNMLREKYTTDTWFSAVPSLGGSTAVQFFVGTTSHFMQVYGMRDKSEGIGGDGGSVPHYK